MIRLRALASSPGGARMLRMVKSRQRAQLGEGIGLASFASVLSVAFPACIGTVIDGAISADSAAYSVEAISGGLFSLFCLQSAVMARRSIVLQQAGDEIAATARGEAFAAILARPAVAFETKEGSPGTLSSVLALDIDQLRLFVAQSAPNAVRSTMTVLGGCGAAAYTSMELFTVSAFLFPLTAGVGIYFSRAMKGQSRAVQDSLADANATATEAAGAITTIKLCAAETEILGRYKDRLAHVLEQSGKIRSSTALVEAATFLGFNVNLCAVLAGGSHLITTHAMTVGELSSFLMLSAFIAGNAVNLTMVYANAVKTFGATERLVAIFDDDAAADTANKNLRLTTAEAVARHPITIEGLHFAFPSRPTLPVLDDFSLHVPAGTSVGITGPSGCGKSAVLQVLTGIYPYDRGSVRIADTELRTLDVRALRAHIAVVPQATQLLNATVRDNITLGAPAARRDRASVAAAAAAAGCSDFVAALPDGLESPIGENGVQLSGGQRQRIALARALLRQPGLLLLDEHTAALDSRTEDAVGGSLAERFGDTTTVFVSHSLDTLRTADVVVVMGEGRVTESGTLEELLRDDGSYLHALVD